jgi:hypothetical protein
MELAKPGPKSVRLSKSKESVLNMTGAGKVRGQVVDLALADRILIRNWLHSVGVDWQKPLDFSGGRVAVARNASNEKLAVSTGQAKDVLWIKALGVGVLLNGQTLPAIPSLAAKVSIEHVDRLDCSKLIVVENRAAFESLEQVVGEAGRAGVAALYRGDPSAPYGQSWLSEKRYSGDLGGYFDFDPAGLAMGLQSGAQWLLLPDLEDLTLVKGKSEDFDRQFQQWQFVCSSNQSVLVPWVEYLSDRREGYVQERLIAMAVRHQWVQLW